MEDSVHRISVSVLSIPAKNDRDNPNRARKSWTWNFVTSRLRRLLRNAEKLHNVTGFLLLHTNAMLNAYGGHSETRNHYCSNLADS